jgi:predicted enzyme related to lactoylglutathione lyase
MVTHLHSVAIFVADRGRALEFYKDALGFEVTADATDPTNPDNRWLTIKPVAGQTNLMLLKRSKGGPENHHPTQLTFATSDIDADCQRIKSHGGIILHPPNHAGWGNALETHFSDPDGNVFMLIQEIHAR